MKLMHSEWQDRVKHWVRTLRDDFYEPLGEIRWEAFRTMDHLSPEEALQGHFTSVEPGFIWGKTWEYCWFKGTVILPKAAEGKRIVMNLDAGGESTVFVNGKAFGNYRAAWVDEPHQFIEDNCLAVSGKEGDTYEILMETYAGHFYPEAPTGGCATGTGVAGGIYRSEKRRGKMCSGYFHFWGVERRCISAVYGCGYTGTSSGNDGFHNTACCENCKSIREIYTDRGF